MQNKKRPIVLAILDGWGHREEERGNALVQGNTEYIDSLRENYPTCKINCSGKAVGLPEGFQGNSEVGHINLGAGRTVYQTLELINEKIENEEFYNNEALLEAVKNCKENDSSLHVMGLLSDKGVHSHINHLFSLLKLAKREGLKKEQIKIHAFTDGRDTEPKAASQYLEELDKKLEELPGELKTIEGRYYAMDRDKRWQRTKKAYNNLIYGSGEKKESWKETLDKSYEEGITDEFIEPTVIGSYEGIKDNDSVVFFNYRLDRGRQLTQAFIEEDFDEFSREKKDVTFVAFAEYYGGIEKENRNTNKSKGKVAFRKPPLKKILGEVLSKENINQFRISETEKYAHVTYFFNGEKKEPFEGEERYIIDSPKVDTYEKTPEMSAYKITEKLEKVIEQDRYDVIIVNFANGDMIGHTGDFQAGIKAAEAVNSCVERLDKSVEKKQGVLLLGADHGNLEEMKAYDSSSSGEKERILTAHSQNPVKLSLIDHSTEGKYNSCKLKEGKLGDVAPTLLEIAGIKKPEEMTGESLICSQ